MTLELQTDQGDIPLKLTDLGSDTLGSIINFSDTNDLSTLGRTCRLFKNEAASALSEGKRQALNTAAMLGNLDLVKRIVDTSTQLGHARIIRPNQNTLENAARSGNQELVQWLMDTERGNDRLRPNQDTLNPAEESGNQELAQWLVVQWLRDYMATEAQPPATANAFQLQIP